MKNQKQPTEKALISGIGYRDPFDTHKNKNDGPLVHILRNYRPSIVQLILTNNRLEYLEKTHWLEDLISFMDENWNYRPRFLEPIIIHTDEPHKLSEVAKTIHESTLDFYGRYSKDYECLVNLSSGTPAMMSVFQIESLIPGIQGIQVEGIPNPPRESEYDFKKAIAENTDEITNSHRAIPTNLNFIENDRQLEYIKGLLEHYDYQVLIDLVSQGQLASLNNNKLLLLLKFANHKKMLEDEADETLKKIEADQSYRFSFPLKTEAHVLDSDDANAEKILIDYFLNLLILNKTNQLTDFFIRLNPFEVALSEYMIQLLLNIIMKNDRLYFEEDELGRPHLNIEALDEDFPGLMDYVRFNVTMGFPENYNDSHYFNIASANAVVKYLYNQYKDSVPELKKMNLEKLFAQISGHNHFRDKFAHNLMLYNKKVKKFLISPQILIRRIQALMVLYFKYLDKDYFSLFDNINAYIIDYLEKNKHN